MTAFHITDPTTGRSIIMQGTTPPSESDIGQAFQNAPQQQSTQQDNPIVGVAKAIFPSTVGAMQNTTNPMTPQGGNPVMAALGNTANLAQNTVMNPGVWGDTAQMVGDASLVKGGVALARNAPNIIKSIPGALKLLTTKGAVDAQTAAVKSAGDLSFNSIKDKVMSKISEFEHPDFKNTVNQLLTRLNPEHGTENIGQLATDKAVTSQQALKYRQVLDSEIPRSAWRDPGAQTPAVRATMAVRNVVDDLLKEGSKDLVKADKMLSTFKKVGGDIPSVLKKLGTGILLDRVAKKVGGQGAETGMDVYSILHALGKL